VLLGVVERAQCADVGRPQALEVEQHRGRDERPCERSAPRLVGAGDEAPAERAVEREQAATRA
jgi:hypothetical protein